MSEYISREAALESFGDAPMWTGYYEPYPFEVHMALTSIAKVIRETITQVPAADVEPVRRGRWISWEKADNCVPSPDRHECSVCHDAAWVLANGLELLSFYCPNCGAKMDLEDENNDN